MVTQVTASLIKQAKQLKRKVNREEHGLFLAEGPQVVQAAIESHSDLVAVFVSPTFDMPIDLSGLTVVELSDREFGQISDTVTPQGILALVRQHDFALSDIKLESGIILYLEEIRDPGNLGTMIRTADAFGADAVVLSPGCVDPTNDKAVRSSAGSIFHIPVIRNIEPSSMAEYCQQKDGEFLVTALDGNAQLDKLAIGANRLLIWAICNEAKGASDELLAVSTKQVRIPMSGKAESLNAAIAAAVCLYASMNRLNVSN